MLFYRFASQGERRRFGGSCFAEFAFCKDRGPLPELLDVMSLPHWQNDSLYVQDLDRLWIDYRDILGEGWYSPESRGLLSPYGLNYYGPEDLEVIISRIRERHPRDWENLLPWLEEARKYNGFYVLGV